MLVSFALFCHLLRMKTLPGIAWLPVQDYQKNLFDEIAVDPALCGSKLSNYGDIVYSKENLGQVFWCRTVLEKPFIAEFQTIREASDILRGIQRNWAHYPVAAFRRAELLKEKLPFINEKPRRFPYTVPLSPMGIWSLIDENTIFASAVTSSPFPCGEIRFEEDHVNPPSRAYQKLYEALTWVSWLKSTNASLSASFPGPTSRCVDAGACPGGWTWVLNFLGAQITAIDRSELDPRLMNKPGITFVKHDAFTLKPADLGQQDWVFSDVICYPARLLEWVQEWLESGLCKNFVCTIKMQGVPDHVTTRAFAAIPGSRIVHLTANKNELTWIRCG